jgi:ubiquinone/menaquinone biosynthesis C-methylase UbiE
MLDTLLINRPDSCCPLDLVMSVLDIGCGPGTITVGFGPYVTPIGLVTGIDHDAENVVSVSKRASEPGMTNVAFKRSDVMALQFEADTFDAVFENNVLFHLADPVAASKEILRVLKPGGRFAAREVDTRMSSLGI